MKRILVLTDFSDIARKGLDTAVRLARQLGNAEILLLNTERSPQGRRFSVTADVTKQIDLEEDRYMIELIRANKQRLTRLMENYESQGVKISPFIEIGPMQDVVDEFLEKRKVDLIIMGTSGESTFEENFVGNHTEQVIRVSDVPVLSVKVNDHSLDFSTIVLATDMNDKASKGLRHIQALADELGARVHMVHVSSSTSDKKRAQLETYATDYGFANYKLALVEDDDTEDGIKKYAAEVGADMIAVVTHGREGLGALLRHSVSDDIIKEASVPVLTVNMNEVK
jgi:nucleotide-binding universal stress UspA family protein